jgi:hypothetical protein
MQHLCFLGFNAVGSARFDFTEYGQALYHSSPHDFDKFATAAMSTRIVDAPRR